MCTHRLISRLAPFSSFTSTLPTCLVGLGTGCGGLQQKKRHGVRGPSAAHTRRRVHRVLASNKTSGLFGVRILGPEIFRFGLSKSQRLPSSCPSCLSPTSSQRLHEVATFTEPPFACNVPILCLSWYVLLAALSAVGRSTSALKGFSRSVYAPYVQSPGFCLACD